MLLSVMVECDSNSDSYHSIFDEDNSIPNKANHDDFIDGQKVKEDSRVYESGNDSVDSAIDPILRTKDTLVVGKNCEDQNNHKILIQTTDERLTNDVECNARADIEKVSGERGEPHIDNLAVDEHLESDKLCIDDRKDHTVDGVYDGWDDWDAEIDEEVISKNAVDEVPAEKPGKPDLDEAKRNDTEDKDSYTWNWNNISNAVTAIGDGLSNIVETKLGLQKAEELADIDREHRLKTTYEILGASNMPVSSFGSLLSNFGSNMVSGSLDVLESIGKSAYESFTVTKEDGKSRRFLFESENQHLNLSEILRELQTKQNDDELNDATFNATTKSMRKKYSLIDLFEKNGGFVHLEGLELISSNFVKSSKFAKGKVNVTISEGLTMEMEDCDVNEDFCEELTRILSLIGLPYDGSVLRSCDSVRYELVSNLTNEPLSAYNDCLECIADLTANSVKLLHKLSQLMLITDVKLNAQPFVEFLGLIGRRVSFYSNQYTYKFSSSNEDVKEDELVTSLLLAANDSYLFVQRCLRLLKPFFNQC